MAKTKAEIEQENEELRRTIEQLETENRQQAALLDAVAQEEGGGWVITTPNATYGGVTAGLLFKLGQAFIPDGNDPAKAKLLATTLKNDFGYSAEHMAAEEVMDLKLQSVDVEDEDDGKGMSEDLLDMYSPAEMLGDDEV